LYYYLFIIQNTIEATNNDIIFIDPVPPMISEIRLAASEVEVADATD
jgi:hypothetical protein